MQLFDDFSIGNIHFKNRILISIPVRDNAKKNGDLSAPIVDDINHLIEGGVGTIILDSVCISRQGKSHSLQLEMNEKYISSFRSLVKHVKEEGVVLGIRLTHCGAKTSEAICGEMPVSSSVINFGKDFSQSYPFDDYGAEEIVLNFKHAAEQAEESGFEIIELNGGSQEFLDQCFNPKFNQREDAYGGCLKNRLTMLKDIVSAIKTRLQHSLLSYYFPVYEKQEGRYNADILNEVVNTISGEGVDILHANALQVLNYIFGEHKILLQWMQEFTSKNLIAAGNLRSFGTLNDAINLNLATFFNIGKSIYTRPNWYQLLQKKMSA